MNEMLHAAGLGWLSLGLTLLHVVALAAVYVLAVFAGAGLLERGKR